jgi:uncharacterized membrane protein YcaP (DUF421 family)
MEVVLRALVMFLFLWLVTRAVGRSTLGELSTFDLLLYVTLGDLIQQAVTQQDYSVTGGMLAIGVFALMTVLLSYSQWRFPKLQPWVNGRAVVVMRDGELVERALRQQRLSLTDLTAAARQQGIRWLDEVDLAVLEADGRISFFTRTDDSPSGAPETSEAA